MENQPPVFLNGPNGRIAYRQRSGEGPGILWLGGFRSDMLGTKANFLDHWACEHKRAFTRFDYTGHGESDGRFDSGSIGAWLEDTTALFDAIFDGPQILIGSSMGAWIAALLALRRPDRISGIVFIAPAPDFTRRLMWPSFTEEQRQKILNEGRLEQPSDYSAEPEVITKKLIEDGDNHLIMDQPIAIKCPVRILQGMCDDAVPWRHALDFADLIESNDLEVTLTKTGDHRLSTPEDLTRLGAILDHISRL